MANVKLHKCFPTVISEFSYHSDIVLQEQMVDYIKKTRKNHMYHTDDTLHNMPHFMDLRDIILDVNKDHLKKLDYKYGYLEITGMWANCLSAGDSHPPHTHSNNFLSGVYYVQASKETSPIQFFDPRAQSSVLVPRKKPNWNNSNMIQFDSVVGLGLIFPSWLQHWVPQNKDNRISISWNIIVRGQYGEPNTLQNANI